MKMPGRFGGMSSGAFVLSDVIDASDRRISLHSPAMMSGVIAALFTAIFLLDIFTPLGLPVSVLYVLPLALTSSLQRREAPYWIAGVSSAASLCDYFLSPVIGGVPSWLPIINRGICLALFWLTAVVIRRQQDLADHLVHAAAIEAENHAHGVKEKALQRQTDEIQDLYNRILDHGIPRYEADGSFAGYIGSCTDINDRKRAEEMPSRLAAIVESSSDAIVSASMDGIVRTWNQGAQRMFGYGEDEMIGRSIRTIIPADRHAEETEIFERVTRGERIEEYETIRIRKDGTTLDVSLTASPVCDSKGSLIGIAKIVRDITTRKQTESALRQKSQLIELSHEPIFSWDVDDGILEWNQGSEQLYGFTKIEAMGRRCHDLLDTVFPEPLHDIMLKVTHAGEWTGELLQRTRDRREVIVESRWSCTEQNGRRIMLETNRDITERKKAETILINKNKDLETLLYVTSHDLKEPLRAIESFSQLVLERYADRIDASGGDYLRRVVRATQRLDRLLSDILELSRAQRMLPPMEDVEAETLVKEALTRLDVRIQETGAAVRIISPLPRLRVNRMWATQGLYNLLANAMKFTCDGHAPDIEIAPYEAPVSTTPVAGVVVKDRGPGVPTRHAERIFMLFQRAVGRNVEGTGAGLTIVRQVAERHGGRAWVQPRPGGGSEFVITFACHTRKDNGGISTT